MIQQCSHPPVQYWPEFLSNQEAEELYTHCRSLNWQQNQFTLYGKTMPLPRLETLYSRRAVTYRYSGGVELQSNPITPLLAKLLQQVEAITKQRYELVIGNHYASGRQHIGWHADKDANMGSRPAIASLSLGARRKFQLRPKGKGTAIYDYWLDHGSLLLMQPGCQQEWLHRLPQTKDTGDRINLTFRPWVFPHDVVDAQRAVVDHRVDQDVDRVENPTQHLQVGDRCQFTQTLFGAKRLCNGVIREFIFQGVAIVDYECSLPAKESLDAFYHRAYPDQGNLYRSHLQIPLNKIKPSPRTLPCVLGEAQPTLFNTHTYATSSNRPALRYFGGKWQLAPWIIQHFPAHTTYCEPFGGAFSVGLRKAPSAVEIYNDLHEGSANFMQQLRENPAQLIAAIEATPRTRSEFQACKIPHPDPVESARRYYLSSQFSWCGEGGRWSSGTSEARLKLIANADDEHLWAVANRLQNVEIYQEDALSIIKRFDGPETLFYVDPPYPYESRQSKDNRVKNKTGSAPRRQYLHEYTAEQHRELAELLRSMQGQVVLSGYHCPLYASLYGDWQYHERPTKTATNTTAIEVLWVSPRTNNAVVNKAEFLPSYYQEVAKTDNNGADHVLGDILTKPPLEHEIAAIRASGPVADPGCWIEVGQVKGRKFRQAWLRSQVPMFPSRRPQGPDGPGLVKSAYLGAEGCAKHREMIAAVDRRNRILKLQKEAKNAK